MGRERLSWQPLISFQAAEDFRGDPAPPADRISANSTRRVMGSGSRRARRLPSVDSEAALGSPLPTGDTKALRPDRGVLDCGGRRSETHVTQITGTPNPCQGKPHVFVQPAEIEGPAAPLQPGARNPVPRLLGYSRFDPEAIEDRGTDPRRGGSPRWLRHHFFTTSEPP